MDKVIFVTGGAGFIGSELIRFLLTKPNYFIVNIDKLSYAGNLESLRSIENKKNYVFERSDITTFNSLEILFNKYEPDIVMHLAAESHVDRSINDPKIFIETNILGTFNLLEASRNYLKKAPIQKKENFIFHHISTDEVFGDLEEGELFDESTSYDPSSPYSASKASSDHLVRAWHRTYNLPSIITNCSNNYGPYQYPEKLIPLFILNALKGKKLSVYGDGNQIRDWLFVTDHVEALYTVLTKGKIGQTYNIGGFNEMKNIDVANKICNLLEELAQINSLSIASGGKGFHSLITFISDRPGHDKRYAINARKIQQELGWKPKETFDSGLKKTIIWYLNNRSWLDSINTNNVSKDR